MEIANAYRRTLAGARESLLDNIEKIHRPGKSEAVHDFRLAIKRIRALLPVVPGLKEIPALDDLFRTSGRVRDLTVVRRTIKEWNPPSSPDVQALRALLKKTQKKARKKLRKKVRLQDAANLKADLTRLVHVADCESAQSIGEGVRTTLECRLTEIGSLSGSLQEARTIHRFRVKIKEAHYLNRLLPPEDRLKIPLEETGELLGRWHDCVVAEKRILNLGKKHPNIHTDPIIFRLRDAAGVLYREAILKMPPHRGSNHDSRISVDEHETPE